ncbi:P-type DNA transfer ATPase VirB11 [Arcobacter lanthieri]|uniref:P-type DNA transfer ATPase VirB11 n=1 Tax=Aliarcobacter lanthieri TaxID=1355374 RepID=UPI001923BD9B|nr:P-type DNA transfer ATPase VirB11 [Aliarcobacter lanthieri]MBL3519507.1 P-type DNA transfer ATPase VirB11 [Aliarcobacter lanthieri]
MNNESDENYSRSLQLSTDRLFEEFLDDDNINEICYNGDGSIWTLDTNSIWTEHKKGYTSKSLESFYIPLASHKEDKISANKPILSAMLNRGERVQVAIPPATKKGMVSITIRKPSKVRFTNEDYKQQGYYDNVKHDDELDLSPDELKLISLYKSKNYLEFIPLAIKLNKNIVIAGATGTGKTTYMKSLIDFIPLDERLITIEDTEEISFHEHKNFVQLFYPSEAKQDDPVTSAILLKSCLRMKPDRVLLAELRGGEAYDYLDILGSGHGGSITSIHAGTVETAFNRLSRMARKNPFASNESAEDIKNEFKDVIDVIINIKEHKGKRWIKDIYLKDHYYNKGVTDEDKIT